MVFWFLQWFLGMSHEFVKKYESYQIILDLKNPVLKNHTENHTIGYVSSDGFRNGFESKPLRKPFQKLSLTKLL